MFQYVRNPLSLSWSDQGLNLDSIDLCQMGSTPVGGPSPMILSASPTAPSAAWSSLHSLSMASAPSAIACGPPRASGPPSPRVSIFVPNTPSAKSALRATPADAPRAAPSAPNSSTARSAGEAGPNKPLEPVEPSPGSQAP